jgi:hypothetical protein
MSVDSKSLKFVQREELCAGSCAAWVAVHDCDDLSCICSIVDTDGSYLVQCACLIENEDDTDAYSITALSDQCSLTPTSQSPAKATTKAPVSTETQAAIATTTTTSKAPATNKIGSEASLGRRPVGLV